MEEITIREKKLKTLDLNKPLDKLEHQKLNYEIECLKEGKQISTYETSIDEKGRREHLMNRPTPYGIAIKAKRAIKESGLELLLNRHTFENFKTDKPYQEHMKQKAVAFAKQPKGLLIMSAQSGVGKTHLATALCGELLLKGYSVKYMKWVDEIEIIKSIDYKDGVKLLNKVKKHDILYIDDFLKADLKKGPTPADIERAFAIIDYRDVNQLPTIISTEMTYEQIKKWDTALAGRIIEMSKDNFIVVNYAKERNYRENFLPKSV